MLKLIVIPYSFIALFIICSSHHVTRKDYVCISSKYGYYVLCVTIYELLNDFFLIQGEFSTKILRFDICKGPKRLDCSDIIAKIENDTNLLIQFNIKKNIIPTRVMYYFEL